MVDYKELMRLKEEFSATGCSFASSASPVYPLHLEASRHEAIIDNKLSAECCLHSSCYCFIHIPNTCLQPTLEGQISFEGLDKLIHPADLKSVVEARKMAYRFSGKHTAAELASYLFTFECRLLYNDRKHYRTMLRYHVAIRGAHEPCYHLMLTLYTINDNGLQQPIPGARIVDTRSRRVVASVDDEPLTSREMEVLKLLKLKWDSRTIGDHLYLSPHTVNNYRCSILSKTRTRYVADAVSYYSIQGLI